jgi:hypothetical protein
MGWGGTTLTNACMQCGCWGGGVWVANGKACQRVAFCFAALRHADVMVADGGSPAHQLARWAGSQGLGARVASASGTYARVFASWCVRWGGVGWGGFRATPWRWVHLHFNPRAGVGERGLPPCRRPSLVRVCGCAHMCMCALCVFMFVFVCVCVFNVWGWACLRLCPAPPSRRAGNLTVRFTSTSQYLFTPGFTAALLGSLCPGGTFSPTGRPVGTPGVCPGVCPAGYACPAGSTSGTAVACAGGTFGVGGLARCPVFYLEDRCVCVLGRARRGGVVFSSPQCPPLPSRCVPCRRPDALQELWLRLGRDARSSPQCLRSGVVW